MRSPLEVIDPSKLDVRSAQAYFASLIEQGVANTTINEAIGDIYYDVTIEGVRFQAYAATHPYVYRKDLQGYSCPFGVASILKSRRNGEPPLFERWMVCKYTAREACIDLSDLTDAGRRAFAVTFGVPFGLEGKHGINMISAFYASKAFEGLVAWASRRPRKFKAERGFSEYVGDWKSVVTLCKDKS